MNYSGQKRKFTPSKWQKEDSDPEDDSAEFDAEEEAELKDLKDLLRELLDVCRKLSIQLQQQGARSM